MVIKRNSDKANNSDIANINHSYTSSINEDTTNGITPTTQSCNNEIVPYVIMEPYRVTDNAIHHMSCTMGTFVDIYDIDKVSSYTQVPLTPIEKLYVKTNHPRVEIDDSSGNVYLRGRVSEPAYATVCGELYPINKSEQLLDNYIMKEVFAIPSKYKFDDIIGVTSPYNIMTYDEYSTANSIRYKIHMKPVEEILIKHDTYISILEKVISGYNKKLPLKFIEIISDKLADTNLTIDMKTIQKQGELLKSVRADNSWTYKEKQAIDYHFTVFTSDLIAAEQGLKDRLDIRNNIIDDNHINTLMTKWYSDYLLEIPYDDSLPHPLSIDINMQDIINRDVIISNSIYYDTAIDLNKEIVRKNRVKEAISLLMEETGYADNYEEYPVKEDEIKETNDIINEVVKDIQDMNNITRDDALNSMKLKIMESNNTEKHLTIPEYEGIDYSEVYNMDEGWD